MKKNIKIFIDTPWKGFLEILMYLIKPFAILYLFLNGVRIGKGAKFYGFPLIYKHKGSRIIIGKNFECRSWWFSNPLGINHPVILCTWAKDAVIKIGNDVGISGTSIVANTAVDIGNQVLIGANATIIDTDFHPLKSDSRRYDRDNIKSYPVKIGDNSFIGMNAIVLKGTKLNNNSIVPAGSVARGSSK
jgi:acetyltransferase-like isoleucine patch superfamily enzyme